ncbi:MAG: hypothetical protein JSS34_05115 [Proteobacteria bacterium]|nr:hypothetical protein [Pseudomonadota bacterium]
MILIDRHLFPPSKPLKFKRRSFTHPPTDTGHLVEFYQELKVDEDYFLLIEYLQMSIEVIKLRERASRKEVVDFQKQATQKYLDFIAFMESFSEAKKRQLIHLICQKYIYWLENDPEDEWRWKPHLSPPAILKRKDSLPILTQWIIDEPQNSEPFKWLGLFYFNTEGGLNLKDEYFTALERSLYLNPKDDIVRKVLISRFFAWIDFSTHHLLSDSGYIGSPTEDLKLCLKIETYIKDLQDRNDQERSNALLKEYREMIQGYQEYAIFRKQNSSLKTSFKEWKTSRLSHSSKDTP